MAEGQESLSRITVSRDALRADLAEMELRLRVYFDDQLRHKADATSVAKIAYDLDKLDRGDFTAVHRRALTALIEEQAVDKSDKGWKNRERLIALGAFALTFGGVVANFLTIHYGG